MADPFIYGCDRYFFISVFPSFVIGYRKQEGSLWKRSCRKVSRSGKVSLLALAASSFL
ncbi:hypothetical protein [Oceanispirochaeta crateris]|uniref:hypothetical protein n=1 Tax=Oceanispirochaeta crateris TaxID=2518645 RepID=UPI00143D96D2|nr:hypothetical protein [Oceanispirochaeta crateris]